MHLDKLEEFSKDEPIRKEAEDDSYTSNSFLEIWLKSVEVQCLNTLGVQID